MMMQFQHRQHGTASTEKIKNKRSHHQKHSHVKLPCSGLQTKHTHSIAVAATTTAINSVECKLNTLTLAHKTTLEIEFDININSETLYSFASAFCRLFVPLFIPYVLSRSFALSLFLSFALPSSLNPFFCLGVDRHRQTILQLHFKHAKPSKGVFSIDTSLISSGTIEIKFLWVTSIGLLKWRPIIKMHGLWSNIKYHLNGPLFARPLIHLPR